MKPKVILILVSIFLCLGAVDAPKETNRMAAEIQNDLNGLMWVTMRNMQMWPQEYYPDAYAAFSYQLDAYMYASAAIEKRRAQYDR